MPSDKFQFTHVSAQEGYNRWAALYDDYDNPLILLEQEQVAELVGDVALLTVIDIGCGTGRHACALARAGANVTAVDFSSGMLDKARTKPEAAGIRFVEHDLHQPLPFADDSFDVMTCCLVLEHITELHAMLAEMHRICKKSGFAVISEMHPAMRLKGAQARFEDPQTGKRICPTSISHQISDFVTAAVRAGWRIDHMSEHSVDDALVTRSPRAEKYLGWPILLVLRLAK